MGFAAGAILIILSDASIGAKPNQGEEITQNRRQVELKSLGEVLKVDLGSVIELQSATFNISIRNSSGIAIHPKSIALTCGCLSAEAKDASIAEGEEMNLSIAVNRSPSKDVAAQAIIRDEHGGQIAVLELTGAILSPFRPNLKQLVLDADGGFQVVSLEFEPNFEWIDLSEAKIDVDSMLHVSVSERYSGVDKKAFELQFTADHFRKDRQTPLEKRVHISYTWKDEKGIEHDGGLNIPIVYKNVVRITPDFLTLERSEGKFKPVNFIGLFTDYTDLKSRLRTELTDGDSSAEITDLEIANSRNGWARIHVSFPHEFIGVDLSKKLTLIFYIDELAVHRARVVVVD